MKRGDIQIVSDLIEHPNRPGLWIYKGKESFPIWWLNDQGYCEYKIFLHFEKGIKSEKTGQMIEGSQIHDKLHSDFKQTSIPSSFKEIVELSKLQKQISREFKLRSLQHGMIGEADEIQFYPDKLIVIDDKPGPRKYPLGKNIPWEGDVNQVYGYCLALKERMIEEFQDTRPIIAALRKRGTNDIYWCEIFDENAENKIIETINHIHRLISLKEEYKSNDKPGKCRGCSFNKECDRNISN